MKHGKMWDLVLQRSAEQAVEHLELEMDRLNLLPMTDAMRELIVMHTHAAMLSVVNAPHGALECYGDAQG